jgi:hypothetical protein
MNRKKRVILAVIIFGLVIYITVGLIYPVIRDSKELLPSSNILPSDYLNLISEKYRDSIEVTETVNSKVRAPVSVFRVNKFHIAVYKINLTSNEPITNTLHEEFRLIKQSDLTTYRHVNISANCHLKYKAGGVDSISNIFLSLSGNSIRTLLSTDLIRAYHLDAEGVSIRYGQNARIDIVIETGVGVVSIPMELLLLKKNNTVFLLVLCPDDISKDFPDLSLYNLISKEE